MTVNDVIVNAVSAELSTVSIGKKLPAERDPILITWINQALREINKRAYFVAKEHIIELVTDSTDGGLSYVLPDDCLKVNAVVNEAREFLSINDEFDPLSVFTPSYNILQVPGAELGMKLSILYSGSPTEVTNTSDVIPCSPVWEDSILKFLEYKAHKGHNQDGLDLSEQYYTKFLNAVQIVINSGLYLDDKINETAFFDVGGWV